MVRAAPASKGLLVYEEAAGAIEGVEDAEVAGSASEGDKVAGPARSVEVRDADRVSLKVEAAPDDNAEDAAGGEDAGGDVASVERQSIRMLRALLATDRVEHCVQRLVALRGVDDGVHEARVGGLPRDKDARDGVRDAAERRASDRGQATLLGDRHPPPCRRRLIWSDDDIIIIFITIGGGGRAVRRWRHVDAVVVTFSVHGVALPLFLHE